MKYLLLILTLLIVSCEAGPRDLRDYYFPVRELTSGQVYVYQDTEQPNKAPSHWYYLGNEIDDGLYLSATAYTPLFEPYQQLTERIYNDGVVLQQLSLDFPDSTRASRMVDAEILAGNVFPFYLEEEENPAYVTDLQFAIPEPPGGRQLATFNRQYLRDTSLEVLGEDREAVVFKMVAEYYVEDETQGGIPSKIEGYEIYANGLGLVETYRETSGGITLLNEKLVEQISMNELIERARAIHQ
ncbi:MAG: hypothetical protein AAF544_03515 [Bacteroidota bacterium]